MSVYSNSSATSRLSSFLDTFTALSTRSSSLSSVIRMFLLVCLFETEQSLGNHEVSAVLSLQPVLSAAVSGFIYLWILICIDVEISWWLLNQKTVCCGRDRTERETSFPVLRLSLWQNFYLWFISQHYQQLRLHSTEW
jgi:hypothetical protein